MSIFSKKGNNTEQRESTAKVDNKKATEGTTAFNQGFEISIK